MIDRVSGKAYKEASDHRVTHWESSVWSSQVPKTIFRETMTYVYVVVAPMDGCVDVKAMRINRLELLYKSRFPGGKKCVCVLRKSGSFRLRKHRRLVRLVSKLIFFLLDTFERVLKNSIYKSFSVGINIILCFF